MQAYQEIIQDLTKGGFKPRLQILDNEASKLLQDEMDNQQIQWQIVPPGNHRRNASERQIRNLKNHFISILAGTDPDFPLHLWDKLIPQSCITLNLICNSHRNPHLSSEAHLSENFDYNTTPLALPGTKVVAFEPPNKCNSWATHGTIGWYIGPALHHYRCWKIYVTKTAATQVCDTVKLFPKQFKMPIVSSADTSTRATSELKEALHHPLAYLPYALLSDNTTPTLKKLSYIFTNATISNPSLPLSSHPDTSKLPRVKLARQGKLQGWKNYERK